MRILLLADPSSIWTIRYIDNVLSYIDADIYICIPTKDLKSKVEYKKRNVNIIAFPVTRFTIPKVSVLINTLTKAFRCKSMKAFDYIHVMFVSLEQILCARLIKKKHTKIILSFMGTDIIGGKIEHDLIIKSLICMCDIVTLSTERIYNRFMYLFGKHYRKKIIRALYGVQGLVDIARISEIHSIGDCKKHFGVNTDECLLAIGYNGSRTHQHIKVLNELQKIKPEYIKKSRFVLHVSYGLEEKYKKELLDNIKISNLRCMLIEDFLDESAIAMLRVATDVYISAQTSDSFSASMQEYIFAGTNIVIPTWNKYAELDQLNFEYITYTLFSELPDILNNAFEIGKFWKRNIKPDIYNLSSWSANRNNWLACYKKDNLIKHTRKRREVELAEVVQEAFAKTSRNKE